jgi:hypothetical protein
LARKILGKIMLLNNNNNNNNNNKKTRLEVTVRRKFKKRKRSLRGRRGKR